MDNAGLLQRRMRQARPFEQYAPEPAWRPFEIPPPVFPERSPGAGAVVPAAPPQEEQVMEFPRPQVIAPTPTEEQLTTLVRSRPSLQEGAPGYRPEYVHPGKLNRVAAILAGVGAGIQEGGAAGYQTAQAVRLGPYQRAVGEWQEQVEALRPMIELEHRRAQLGQTQFGHEVALTNAMLDRMSAQELNELRAHELDSLNRNRAALLQEQDADRRARLRIAAQESADRLAAINQRIEASQARARTAAEAEAGRAARSGARLTQEQAQFEARQVTGELPYSRIPEDRWRAMQMLDIVQEHPEWGEFFDTVDVPGGWFTKERKATFQLVPPERVPRSKRAQYQLARTEYQKRIRNMPVTVEKVE